MEIATAGRELTALDRCDACGAAAKVIATLLNGELMFCGHHARKSRETLTKQAVEVWDPFDEFSTY